MAKRSLIRLEKLYADEAPGRRNRPVEDQPTYAWSCDERRLAAAEFVDRYDSTQFAILHRSSKPDADRYPWQISFFDSRGPASDSRAKTCAKALENVPHFSYRLRKAVPR